MLFRSIRSLRKVTARHPDDIGASEWLLSLLREQQRWPEATREFLAFSRTSAPPGEIVQVGLGLAQELANARQGNEAEAVYRRLLELDPDDSWLLNGLAYLYADVLETHLDQAEQMARKALEEPPASRGILYRFEWNLAHGAIVDTLAWVYFKEGKLKAAYATQRQAIRLAGNRADVRCHMGAIDEARGDLAAARQEYERALRLDPRQAAARRALEKLRRGPPALPPAPPRAGTKVTAG